MNELGRIHRLDARRLCEVVDGEIVDVTITSPPYFDLKNYGHRRQIGYGQTYEQYLDDLENIFTSVFKVTKKTGTLWVIIDMFKKDGEVVALPFDFVTRIKAVGWKLQEVIIWEKDRTVPWSHGNQVRNAFEYILVFSKTKKPKFHIERVKDVDSLKKWWIRYPERYNPKGKSPAAIWNFDIPTQGSWGNGYIRHFCPLPEELITQILKISSDEGDIVLDPFAGSGSVLARADNMKRHYIGLELNPDYIKMFEKYLIETGGAKRIAYEKSKEVSIKQLRFEELILNLRVLKFARSLLKQIGESHAKNILKIFIPKSKESSDLKHKLRKAEYHLLVSSSKPQNLEKKIAEVIAKPPLSKFGIEASIILHDSLKSFTNKMTGRRSYVYTETNTHSFKKIFQLSDLSGDGKKDKIISEIKVDVDEQLHE